LKDDDHIVDFNDVWGGKAWELHGVDDFSPEKRMKCRIVAWRERLKGRKYKVSGVRDGEVLVSWNPSPAVCRLTAAFGAAEKRVQRVRDLDNGYFQARDEGKPAYANLPEILWPPEWHELYAKDAKDLSKRPLCPLLGSQYGRDRAAGDFYNFKNRELNAAGLMNDNDVEPCLYTIPIPDEHFDQVRKDAQDRGVDFSGVPERHAVPDHLLSYTDDNLSGFTEQTNVPLVAIVQDRLKSGPASHLDGAKYVGINYSIKHDKSGKFVHVGYEQRAYIRSVVDEFALVLENRTGQKLRPRRSPLPVAEKQRFYKAESTEAAYKEGEKFANLEKGLFAEDCRHWVGELLFVGRCCRPDITYAVTFLAGEQESWNTDTDRELIWLMGYLKATGNKVLRGKLFYADQFLWTITLETDGSHAGCKSSRKGVSGYAVYLTGPHGTRILIDWGCKKQQTQALSSGECEAFAMMFGSKSVIKLVMCLNRLMGFGPSATVATERLHSDSKVAITAVQKANSEAMRHMRRTAGVCLGWLHSYWCDCGDKRVVEWSPGKELSADAQTKALNEEDTQRNAMKFGLVDLADDE